MIWNFLLGLVIGVIVGVFLTALLCAGEDDEK